MKYRKTEIKVNEEWKEIDFDDLKVGNIFRLFEPDGTIVKDNDGKENFIVTTLPFPWTQVTKEGTIIVSTVESIPIE